MKISVKKKILLCLVFIIVILTGLYLSGFVRSSFENKKLRKELVGDAQTVEIDLDINKYPDLPEPVKRYFIYTFNGQKSIKIKNVFWKEKGKFKLPISPKYFDIKSAQTSLTTEPKYMWEGLYSDGVFKFPVLESRDAFSIDSHNMRAKVFGAKTVMSTNYTAEQKDSLHSYLMLRYYGTALDFPWALLPSKYVKWSAVDDQHAYLDITYNNLKGRYLVTINEKGQITKLETPEYMLHGNSEKLREVGEKSEYKEINGFMIPTHMNYSWYKENNELDSNYVFDIYDIQYIK